MDFCLRLDDRPFLSKVVDLCAWLRFVNSFYCLMTTEAASGSIFYSSFS